MNARTAITLSYFSTGVLNAVWGATLPSTDLRLDLGAGRLGTVLIALAAGALLAMPVAGWLAERWTGQNLLRVAAPGAALALIGPALASSFPVLIATVVALGMLFGALNVGLSVQAVAVEQQAGRPIMATMHGTWTLGAVAGGAAVALGLSSDVNGRSLMLTGAIVLTLAALAIGRPRTLTALQGEHAGALPTAPWRKAARPGDAQSLSGSARRGSLGKGERPSATVVVALGVMGAAAFITEGAATDWAGVHATRVLNAEPATASLVYTVFFVAMTAVRFAGDALRSRLGAAATTQLAGSVATAGLGLVLLAGIVPSEAQVPLAIAGWALAGVGMAVVWPVVTSALGAANGGGRKLSFVTMISYGGGLLGPALIGYVAAAASLPVALFIPAGMALLVAVMARPVLGQRPKRPQKTHVTLALNLSGGTHEHA
ncbi:MFS transporter [Catelliglobosispora koreensis]|uniref:MFS transporter n=1 Tax=Catelliglobosispora koreensis TaxID=129052 RepID=UPI00036CABEE|nr:MFS transporter [Catelliglobosispora koreensis]